MESFTIFPLHNNIFKTTGLILAILTMSFIFANNHYRIIEANNIINWIFCLSLFIFAFSKFDNENQLIKKVRYEALQITLGLELFIILALTLSGLVMPFKNNINLLSIVFTVLAFYIIVFYILILVYKNQLPISEIQENQNKPESSSFYVIYMILIILIFIFAGHYLF